MLNSFLTKSSLIKRVTLFATVPVMVLSLSACDLSRNQMRVDRANNMEFQDFREGLAPREQEGAVGEAEDEVSEGIPALQSYMLPPSENLKAMPLVSISMNQTVPLRDALFELASQADYDLELDPRIKGSIIFTAFEKPFDTVVKRIAEISGLRYRFEDDSLRVELDLPYNKTYKIDYLSYIRRNNSSIRNDVAVVTGDGADTGSEFEASSESEIDFWGELESNLTQILGVAESRGTLRTEIDPQITATPQNAPVSSVVGENSDGSVNVQAPQAVLQVSALPTDTMTGGSNMDEEERRRQSSFSLNKQAGMVSVYATERQHEEIQEFMQRLRRSVTSQVLIEAKVLEVSLTDEYSSGIDWSAVNLMGGDLNFGFDAVSGAAIRPDLNPVISPATDFVIDFVGNDLSAAVEAISRFGTVRALSSPRLTVLNNQSAVLNVAKNQVYFEIEIETTEGTDGSGDRTTVDSEIRNVPEGILINVQPSIDLDDRKVSMAVRPTITRIVDFVEDPGVQFVAAENGVDISSLVPVVNVQEMDSVISVSSGQAVVMGGLMQDRSETTETGVPVLSEVPVLGSLFKTHGDSISKTELVVFLKATIIEGSNIHQTDKDVYRTFSGDRRPLRF